MSVNSTILFILLALCTTATLPAQQLYVAPDGADDAAGTPDAPLASIAGARDRIRAIKQLDGLPDGGITVYFRGGHYYVDQTVRFDADDSGQPDKPVVYAAYPGETPVFTGGRYFDAQQCTAPPVHLANRLSTQAQSHVRAVSLYDNGFTYADLDYAKPWYAERDFNNGGESAEYSQMPRMMSVYVDDTPLQRARWPNRTLGLPDAPPNNSYLYIEDGGTWVHGEQYPYPHPSFTIPESVAARMDGWQNPDVMTLAGMFSYSWAFEFNRMYDFDRATRTITINANRQYEEDRIPTEGKYFFENVLEELDAPGEFFIDKQSGTLLFYPPEDAGSTWTLKVPKLEEWSMLELIDASHIRMEALTLELTKGAVVVAYGGTHIGFDACTFKNAGNTALDLGNHAHTLVSLANIYVNEHFLLDDHPTEENGTWYSITNSTILNTGRIGVNMYCGNPARRESGHFLFENNIVSYAGTLSGGSGMHFSGVGGRILRNTFAHCTWQGFGGDMIDCEVAYNEIYNCPGIIGANDLGSLFISGGHSEGVHVHDNYVHHIDHAPVRWWESWKVNNIPNRTMLYMEGANRTGLKLERNIVYNAVSGMFLGEYFNPGEYGNNLFVDCLIPVEADHLGDLAWVDWHLSGETDITPWFFGETKVFYDSRLYENEWYDLYPEMRDYFAYLIGKGGHYDELMSKVYNNIAVNINVPLTEAESEEYSGWTAKQLPADDLVKVDPVYGRYGNNRYLSSDPGFVNYAGGDVQLTPAAADALGIEWIDMSLIGAKRWAAAPLIVAHPQDIVATVGESASLHVDVRSPDGGTLACQWYAGASGDYAAGVAIDGATNSDCTPSTHAVGTTYYYVVVTNASTGKIAVADTSRIAVVTVNDLPAPSTYAVTIASTLNGSVTPDRQQAEAGTSITLTITPDEDCELTALHAFRTGEPNTPVTLYPVALQQYRFTMPAFDVTVEARFAVGNESVIADRVWSHDGRLHVRLSTPSTLRIHTAAGHLYAQRPLEAGLAAIPLPSGIYIITLNGRQWKVAIP